MRKEIEGKLAILKIEGKEAKKRKHYFFSLQ
jgi:hypothetical protein